MIASCKKCKSQKAWIFLGLLAFGVMLFFPQLSQAQSSRDLNNRLNRLENEIQTLNRAVYKGESPPPSAVSGGNVNAANAEVRLQQLEVELRDMRGKLEEQSFQIRQLTEKIDRVVGDLELRMGDLEKRGGVSGQYDSPVNPAQLPNVPRDNNGAQNGGGDNFTWNSNPNPAPANQGQLGTISNSGGDAAASSYENAFSLLKNSNYEAAGKGFDAFIQQYPNHALVGNAKYWLGETYYVRGDYKAASRIFAEGYQKFPKGTKAADNLLKLGMSLAAMGSKNDACIAFGQLQKDFSGGPSPVLRRAEQEMTRINCS